MNKMFYDNGLAQHRRTNTLQPFMFALLISSGVQNLDFGHILGTLLTTQKIIIVIVGAYTAFCYINNERVLIREFWWIPFYGIFLALSFKNMVLIDATPIIGMFPLVKMTITIFIVHLFVSLSKEDPTRLVTNKYLAIFVSLSAIFWLTKSYFFTGSNGVGEVFHQGYRLRNEGERTIVNPWAITIALYLPITICGAFLTSSKLNKALHFISGLLMLSCVILTFSRGPLFALLGGFLIAAALEIRRPKEALKFLNRAIIALVLVFSGIVFFKYQLISFWVGRILMITNPEGRIWRIQEIMERVRGREFFGGIETDFVADVQFFSIFADWGFFGLVVFLIFLFILSLNILYIRRRSPLGLRLCMTWSFSCFAILLWANDLLLLSPVSVWLGVLIGMVSGLRRASRSHVVPSLTASHTYPRVQ